MDRVVGLEIGADDDLPKPFEPRELLARLQTVLRRARGSAAPEAPGARRLAFDGLTIDLDRREVQRHGEALDLTGTEFELLALLAQAPSKVFSRDQILERLRGQAAEDLYTRAVDILVSRLRKKLEPLDVIKTLRNAGYTFAAARAP
jgi:OmpR family response regulator RpaB